MAVAALILLLVALISNSIHAVVIQAVRGSHHFILNQTADFCLISKWTGDEKKLLWNSLASHGFGMERNASYQMSGLNVSDSGWYQEQCWTQGNVTHEKNSTLLVCDDQKTRDRNVFVSVGQAVELTCDGGGPNQSFQWFINFRNSKTKNLEFALIDHETYTTGEVSIQLVKNKSSLLVTGCKPSDEIVCVCLEINHGRCDILSLVLVHVLPEIIYRAVGDSLEMNCSGTSGNQADWTMKKSFFEEEESLSYTVRFPSLTVDHAGYYYCDVSDEYYYLLACPESGPPTLVWFSEGENLTLKCGDWTDPRPITWLLKSNRTGGRVQPHLSLASDPEYDHIDLHGTDLVIHNISLEDSGEFWCAAALRHCLFSHKTVVMIREAEVDHHLVRSVLVSVLVTVMCVVAVVIVATVRRTRRRELLPVPVEEVEMSVLSAA